MIYAQHVHNVDLLIAGLAATIAEQRVRIQALEALACSQGDTAASYRLLARSACAALREAHVAAERQAAQLEHLRSEFRDFRARVMRRDGVAA